MLILKQLILGLLLPAVVGGGIFIFAKSLAWKKESEQKKARLSGWLVAVALSAGYTVGYTGLEGLPPFPPREGVHWLCYLSIIGLISGAFWHSSRWGRLIVQIALSIVIPRLLLNSAFKYTWGQFEGIIWWMCLAVAVFIFWHIVQESFTILPAGGSSPFVYFGLSGGTALVLAVSGSLRLAQHAGILVAIFAASWVITFVRQRSDNNKWQVFPLGASPVVALLLLGIWMNGYFYEEVPAASAILLAIALFLAPVGRIEKIQRLGARRSAIVQICVIALPVVIAIGIAVARSGLFGESSSY
ncbi:hypothetical protein C6499_10370 [Candidatus Poribacteria bacterium]|nr:MAG: hypothetical protein C6499_10370 [Candidatus Poribacteria bacterium]